MEAIGRRLYGIEERALTREDLPAVMFPDQIAPEAPGPRQAMQLADVFACVRVLADGAAMAPLHVYRRGADATRERADQGALVDLLREPSPGVTQPALVATLIAHLALWGECFLGRYGGPDGAVAQLAPLAPERVEVELIGGEPRYTYSSPEGRRHERLTRDDVIHVRGLSLDGVRGASPIALCREATGLAKSLDTAGSAFWANGAIPRGVLSVPSGPGADDQAESLKQGFQKRHQGPKNTGRVAVVTGEVNFSPVSMPLADAEFIATRQLSTAEVARILRVPPWMIGAKAGDSLTYSTVAMQASAFVRFSLGPMLRLIEEALSLDELLPPAHYVRFSLDGLLRGDAAERASFYQAALGERGWMTRAEVRALEDLPPGTEPEEVPDAPAE